MTDQTWASLNWNAAANWQTAIRDLKVNTNPTIATLRQTISEGGSLSPIAAAQWWANAGRSISQLTRWRNRLALALRNGKSGASYWTEAAAILPTQPPSFLRTSLEWALFDTRRQQVEILASYQLRLLSAAQAMRRGLLGKPTATAAQVKEIESRSSSAAVRTAAPGLADFMPKNLGLYLAITAGVYVALNYKKD